MIINQNNANEEIKSLIMMLPIIIIGILVMPIGIGVDSGSILLAFVLLGIFIGFLIPLSFFLYVAFCKFIEIDLEGCTITIPHLYRKKLKWDQIQTKNLEDFYLCLHLRYSDVNTNFKVHFLQSIGLTDRGG